MLEFGSAGSPVLGSLAPAFGSVAPVFGSAAPAFGSEAFVAFGSAGFVAVGSVLVGGVEEGSVVGPMSKGGEVVSDIEVESRQKAKRREESKWYVWNQKARRIKKATTPSSPREELEQREREKDPCVNEEDERLALERREGSTVEPSFLQALRNVDEAALRAQRTTGCRTVRHESETSPRGVAGSPGAVKKRRKGSLPGGPGSQTTMDDLVKGA